jgi:hypothetical protein
MYVCNTYILFFSQHNLAGVFGTSQFGLGSGVNSSFGAGYGGIASLGSLTPGFGTPGFGTSSFGTVPSAQGMLHVYICMYVYIHI